MISSPPPLLCPVCPPPVWTDGSWEAAGLRLEAEAEMPAWAVPDTSRSSRELPDWTRLDPARGLSAAGVSARRAERVPAVSSGGETWEIWPGDSEDLRREEEGEVERLMAWLYVGRPAPGLLTTIRLLTVTRAARLAAGTGTVGRTGPAFLCSSSFSWVSAIMRLCTMAEIASCWFSPGFPPVGFCWGEAEARTGPAVEDVGRSGLARGAVGSLLAMEVGTETSQVRGGLARD